MYKSIFIILAILTVIATACICIKQPQMHKTVFIYDSQFTITPTNEIIVEQKETPVMEQPAAPQTKKAEITTQDFVQTQQTVKYVQPKVQTAKKPVTTKTITQTKPQKITVAPKTSTKTTTPQIDVQKIVANNKNIQSTSTTAPQNSVTPVTQTVTTKPVVQTAPIAKTTKSKTVTPTVTKTTQAPVARTMTAQEEEIAWNVWRSNLTNKIMEGTNFPAVPAGTIFHFEFNVDKYGKITNVQTWSETSKYTPYAIQYMAPVIRNLQGRSILNFPAGTARTSTKAYGAWKISNRTILSTPDNYNDIEKITK